MIIDRQTSLAGAFNFTKAADESNAENLLVIRNAKRAAKYSTNWTENFQHSEPYPGESSPR